MPEYLPSLQDVLTIIYNQRCRKSSFNEKATVALKYTQLTSRIDVAALVTFANQLVNHEAQRSLEYSINFGMKSRSNELMQLGDVVSGAVNSLIYPITSQYGDQYLGSIHNHPFHGPRQIKDWRHSSQEPHLGDSLSFPDMNRVRRSTDGKIAPIITGIVHGRHLLFAMRSQETPLYWRKDGLSTSSVLYRSLIFNTTVFFGGLLDVATLYKDVEQEAYISKSARYINREFAKKFKIGLYQVPNYIYSTTANRIA